MCHHQLINNNSIGSSSIIVLVTLLLLVCLTIIPSFSSVVVIVRAEVPHASTAIFTKQSGYQLYLGTREYFHFRSPQNATDYPNVMSSETWYSVCHDTDSTSTYREQQTYVALCNLIGFPVNDSSAIYTNYLTYDHHVAQDRVMNVTCLNGANTKDITECTILPNTECKYPNRRLQLRCVGKLHAEITQPPEYYFDNKTFRIFVNDFRPSSFYNDAPSSYINNNTYPSLIPRSTVCGKNSILLPPTVPASGSYSHDSFYRRLCRKQMFAYSTAKGLVSLSKQDYAWLNNVRTANFPTTIGEPNYVPAGPWKQPRCFFNSENEMSSSDYAFDSVYNSSLCYTAMVTTTASDSYGCPQDHTNDAIVECSGTLPLDPRTGEQLYELKIDANGFVTGRNKVHQPDAVNDFGYVCDQEEKVTDEDAEALCYLAGNGSWTTKGSFVYRTTLPPSYTKNFSIFSSFTSSTTTPTSLSSFSATHHPVFYNCPADHYVKIRCVENETEVEWKFRRVEPENLVQGRPHLPQFLPDLPAWRDIIQQAGSMPPDTQKYLCRACGLPTGYTSWFSMQRLLNVPPARSAIGSTSFSINSCPDPSGKTRTNFTTEGTMSNNQFFFLDDCSPNDDVKLSSVRVLQVINSLGLYCSADGPANVNRILMIHPSSGAVIARNGDDSPFYSFCRREMTLDFAHTLCRAVNNSNRSYAAPYYYHTPNSANVADPPAPSPLYRSIACTNGTNVLISNYSEECSASTSGSFGCSSSPLDATVLKCVDEDPREFYLNTTYQLLMFRNDKNDNNPNNNFSYVCDNSADTSQEMKRNICRAALPAGEMDEPATDSSNFRLATTINYRNIDNTFVNDVASSYPHAPFPLLSFVSSSSTSSNQNNNNNFTITYQYNVTHNDRSNPCNGRFYDLVCFSYDTLEFKVDKEPAPSSLFDSVDPNTKNFLYHRLHKSDPWKPLLANSYWSFNSNGLFHKNISDMFCRLSGEPTGFTKLEVFSQYLYNKLTSRGLRFTSATVPSCPNVSSSGNNVTLKDYPENSKWLEIVALNYGRFFNGFPVKLTCLEDDQPKTELAIGPSGVMQMRESPTGAFKNLCFNPYVTQPNHPQQAYYSEDALKVMCTATGQVSDGGAVPFGPRGAQSDPDASTITYYNFSCPSASSDPSSCAINTGSNPCSGNNQYGFRLSVICRSAAPTKSWSFRLSPNPTTPNLLEVRDSGADPTVVPWGNVGASDFDADDARVICSNYFGTSPTAKNFYSTVNKRQPSSSSSSSSSPPPVYLDGLGCNENSTSLSDCPLQEVTPSLSTAFNTETFGVISLWCGIADKKDDDAGEFNVNKSNGNLILYRPTPSSPWGHVCNLNPYLFCRRLLALEYPYLREQLLLHPQGVHFVANIWSASTQFPGVLPSNTGVYFKWPGFGAYNSFDSSSQYDPYQSFNFTSWQLPTALDSCHLGAFVHSCEISTYNVSRSFSGTVYIQAETDTPPKILCHHNESANLPSQYQNNSNHNTFKVICKMLGKGFSNVSVLSTTQVVRFQTRFYATFTCPDPEVDTSVDDLSSCYFENSRETTYCAGYARVFCDGEEIEWEQRSSIDPFAKKREYNLVVSPTSGRLLPVSRTESSANWTTVCRYSQYAVDQYAVSRGFCGMLGLPSSSSQEQYSAEPTFESSLSTLDCFLRPALSNGNFPTMDPVQDCVSIESSDLAFGTCAPYNGHFSISVECKGTLRRDVNLTFAFDSTTVPGSNLLLVNFPKFSAESDVFGYVDVFATGGYSVYTDPRFMEAELKSTATTICQHMGLPKTEASATIVQMTKANFTSDFAPSHPIRMKEFRCSSYSNKVDGCYGEFAPDSEKYLASQTEVHLLNITCAGSKNFDFEFTLNKTNNNAILVRSRSASPSSSLSKWGTLYSTNYGNGWKGQTAAENICRWVKYNENNTIINISSSSTTAIASVTSSSEVVRYPFSTFISFTSMDHDYDESPPPDFSKTGTDVGINMMNLQCPYYGGSILSSSLNDEEDPRTTRARTLPTPLALESSNETINGGCSYQAGCNKRYLEESTSTCNTAHRFDVGIRCRSQPPKLEIRAVRDPRSVRDFRTWYGSFDSGEDGDLSRYLKIEMKTNIDDVTMMPEFKAVHAPRTVRWQQLPSVVCSLLGAPHRIDSGIGLGGIVSEARFGKLDLNGSYDEIGFSRFICAFDVAANPIVTTEDFVRNCFYFEDISSVEYPFALLVDCRGDYISNGTRVTFYATLNRSDWRNHYFYNETNSSKSLYNNNNAFDSTKFLDALAAELGVTWFNFENITETMSEIFSSSSNNNNTGDDSHPTIEIRLHARNAEALAEKAINFTSDLLQSTFPSVLSFSAQRTSTSTTTTSTTTTTTSTTTTFTTTTTTQFINDSALIFVANESTDTPKVDDINTPEVPTENAAVLSTAGISKLASMSVANAALMMRNSVLVNSIGCGSELKRLDIATSPTQITIGTGSWRFLLGSVVGNGAIIVVASLMCGIALVAFYCSAKPKLVTTRSSSSKSNNNNNNSNSTKRRHQPQDEDEVPLLEIPLIQVSTESDDSNINTSRSNNNNNKEGNNSDEQHHHNESSIIPILLDEDNNNNNNNNIKSSSSSSPTKQQQQLSRFQEAEEQFYDSFTSITNTFIVKIGTGWLVLSPSLMNGAISTLIYSFENHGAAINLPFGLTMALVPVIVPLWCLWKATTDLCIQPIAVVEVNKDDDDETIDSNNNNNNNSMNEDHHQSTSSKKNEQQNGSDNNNDNNNNKSCYQKFKGTLFNMIGYLFGSFKQIEWRITASVAAPPPPQSQHQDKGQKRNNSINLGNMSVTSNSNNSNNNISNLLLSSGSSFNHNIVEKEEIRLANEYRAEKFFERWGFLFEHYESVRFGAVEVVTGGLIGAISAIMQNPTASETLCKASSISIFLLHIPPTVWVLMYRPVIFRFDLVMTIILWTVSTVIALLVMFAIFYPESGIEDRLDQASLFLAVMGFMAALTDILRLLSSTLQKKARVADEERDRLAKNRSRRLLAERVEREQELKNKNNSNNNKKPLAPVSTKNQRKKADSQAFMIDWSGLKEETSKKRHKKKKNDDHDEVTSDIDFDQVMKDVLALKSPKNSNGGREQELELKSKSPDLEEELKKLLDEKAPLTPKISPRIPPKKPAAGVGSNNSQQQQQRELRYKLDDDDNDENRNAAEGFTNYDLDDDVDEETRQRRENEATVGAARNEEVMRRRQEMAEFLGNATDASNNNNNSNGVVEDYEYHQI